MGKLRLVSSKNGKVVVREENFGSDPSVVLYPGLSSCITITLDSPQGLLGVHITVLTEDYIIDEMFNLLAHGVGEAFVVGQIEEYKLKTQLKSFNTRKKMSSKLKRAIDGVHKVVFFDLGRLSHDADLLVRKNGIGLEFGWAPIRKIGWEVENDIGGFVSINAKDFLSR